MLSLGSWRKEKGFQLGINLPDSKVLQPIQFSWERSPENVPMCHADPRVKMVAILSNATSVRLGTEITRTAGPTG